MNSLLQAIYRANCFQLVDKRKHFFLFIVKWPGWKFFHQLSFKRSHVLSVGYGVRIHLVVKYERCEIISYIIFSLIKTSRNLRCMFNIVEVVCAHMSLLRNSHHQICNQHTYIHQISIEKCNGVRDSRQEYQLYQDFCKFC